MINRKRICQVIIFSVGFVSGLLSIVTYVESVYKEKIIPRFHPWIDISSPPYKIPSNLFILSGKFGGSKGDVKVRVYIWPDDNSGKFWLQNPKLNYAYNNRWAEMGCFGNPKRIDHTKIDPTFYVYAVLVNASYVDSLPGANSSCPWIQSEGETSFIDLLRRTKGVRAISSACAINRTDISCPDLLLVSPRFNETVKSPVKPQWTPDGRMYVELFNSGCRIYEGYLANGSELPIRYDSLKEPPSSYFQIVVSERKNNECQAVSWFRLTD